jgi:hypothetical protein
VKQQVHNQRLRQYRKKTKDLKGYIMWHGTVSEFCQMAQLRTLRAVVLRECSETLTTAEKQDGSAWERTLYSLATKLDNKGLDKCHIVVEALMPNSSARADFVLLGTGMDTGRRCLVIEAKMWDKCTATSAGRVSFDQSQDSTHDRLHPCWQSRGYRDQLSCFSSALVDKTPTSIVNAIAFMPEMSDIKTLSSGNSEENAVLNASVANQCPAFGKNDLDEMINFILDFLPLAPASSFVEEFVKAKRKPGIELAEIAEKMLEKYPLVDEQLEAALHLHNILKEGSSKSERRVVIVTGGPGSGKTVLAIHTLLHAIASHRLINSAFVTTSGAHNNAVEGEMHLNQLGYSLPLGIQNNLPVLSARKRALKFPVPGFQTKSEAMKADIHFKNCPSAWRTYCKAWYERFSLATSAVAPEFDVLVCDEAQALINVEKDEPYARGAGWVFSSGPQAAHLIQKAKVSVFLLDGAQGYRDVESTTPDDIHDLALRLGVQTGNISILDLGNVQFRLNGNSSYLSWIDWVLGLNTDKPKPTTNPEKLKYLFSIYDNPSKMRDDLRQIHDTSKRQCRLLASYGWKWVSKNDPTLIDSHHGTGSSFRSPPPGMKFKWLYPEEKERAFNLGLPPFDNPETLFGIGADIPAHVGYPLTVRGREFDHVGVMWASNLIRRNGTWKVDKNLIFGTDLQSTMAKAKKEHNPYGKYHTQLATSLAQSIRILLTRGMSSVRVWIEDTETRNYIQKEWNKFIK